MISSTRLKLIPKFVKTPKTVKLFVFVFLTKYEFCFSCVSPFTVNYREITRSLICLFPGLDDRSASCPCRNAISHSEESLSLIIPATTRALSSCLSLPGNQFNYHLILQSRDISILSSSIIFGILNRSVLLVEGKSADLAKFAIHSIRKQRILITFAKSQPRNSISGSNWGPPPSRSPNQHIRHPTGPPKHYPIPTTGVLPTPTHRPPNGAVQPIFIAPSPPLAPPMPFPPGPTVWPLPPHPRHQPPPQPRMPIPGTGVFLPPGSTQEQVLQGSQQKSDYSNGGNSAEGKLELKTKEEASTGGIAAEERDGSNGSGDGKQNH